MTGVVMARRDPPERAARARPAGPYVRTDSCYATRPRSTVVARDVLAGVGVDWRELVEPALCGGCAVDIDEWYMVHDDLWPSGAFRPGVRQYLCVACLEAFLGRRLTPDDFTDCSLNAQNVIIGSARLVTRLLGIDDDDDPVPTMWATFEQRLARIDNEQVRIATEIRVLDAVAGPDRRELVAERMAELHERLKALAGELEAV
jgi:hypothetical protein